jgi:DNA polymerase-3 subunit alpha
LPTPTPLVDIGVEDDHTFYVSDKPDGLYLLTHNSYPDVDSDFADRDKATKLLSEFFGEENVVPVSLFSQLQLKSLIKDVAKLHNLPFDEINSSTGKIEGEVLAVKKQEDGFDRATWDLTFEEAMLYSPTFQELMEKHPEFETTIKVLFKQMRNVGRHAGGVIITDNSREAMPMIKSGGELQTPWPEGVNYRHLEEFGLLKFDILGLGTLRMFENCTRRILRKQGVKNPTFKEVKQWFWDNLHPDNNPMDDMNVYKHVFWDGNYHSIFQFINDQTQGFMRQMKPKSILDIAVATSIFRPGPLSAGVDKMYLKNRSNPDRVVYKHELLREVFKETEGLLIFQEQLQMVYNRLAGIPLEDTDGIRKAFTKKDKSNKEKAAKDREDLKNTFLKLCRDNNNISESISSELFDEMEKLVAYSFNKSHAVCYAITSWQCAWFLTYHPDEWVATSIDYCTTSKGKVTGKEDPKVVALSEAKGLGYSLSKPDINISELEFIVDPNKPKTLVPSFSSLKYVGKTAFTEIEQFRPYNTIQDLLVNPDNSWRHSKFSSRALDTLIKMEALDSMGLVGEDKPLKNYRQLHELLITNNNLLKRTAAKKKNNSVKTVIDALIPTLQELPDWTREEKIEFSKTLAGAVDLDLIIPQSKIDDLQASGFQSIDDYEEKGNYWAVVSSFKLAKTKNGKPFLKVRLYGPQNKEHTLFVWNWKGEVMFKPYDIVIGLLDQSSFGFSCFQNKLFSVNG